MSIGTEKIAQAATQNELGSSLLSQGRYQEAQNYLSQAIRLHPDFAEAYYNLGLAFQALGRHGQALAHFEQAVRIREDFPQARYQRGLTQLLLGDFQQGWLDYEYRDPNLRARFSQPYWTGEPLEGKTILLWADQGISDTIQFLRFLPWVREKGGKIILECQPELLRLLQTLEGVESVVAAGSAQPSFDVHAALGSLPGLFRHNPVHQTFSFPYLKTDPKLQTEWEKKLHDFAGLRIGVSGKEFSSLFAGFSKGDFHLFDLERSNGEPHLRDLSELAAAMNEMDLILTADPVLGHLAAALDRPVWMLIPSSPDWRWMLGQHDSPWYPSLRLFRQPADGSWDPVFKEIQEELGRVLQAWAQSQPDPFREECESAMGFYRQGKLEQAIQSFRKAIEIQPENAEIHCNLGSVLIQAGCFDEGMIECLEALRINPNLAEGYCSLGVAMYSLQEPEEAMECYRIALDLQPEFPEAENNLGNALRALGKLNEAIVHYEKALRLSSQYAEAHFNLGCSYLALGDFKKGWPEYEYRWKCKSYLKPRFDKPAWDGSSFQGKKLLLYAEQGFGDTIQFIRYAKLAKDRGGEVFFECPAELLRLFQSVAGVDRAIPQGQALPDFDFHAPLLSLPAIFQTELSSIPANTPYLDLQTEWGDPELQALIPENKNLKVGICWSGSPKQHENYRRSASLAHFLSLSKVRGLQFYSFQKGPQEEEWNAAGDCKVINLAPALKDFASTAFAMSQMDLILTVDTSVAHLAGALNKETWLLLSALPDWRWMNGDAEKNLWYPSFRLFHQPHLGEWDSLFQRLARELTWRVAKKEMGK